jgi:hypothetical protein
VKQIYDTDPAEVLEPLRRKIFALCGRLHSPTRRLFKEKIRPLYYVVTIMDHMKRIQG